MISHIGKVGLGMIVALAVLCSACLVAPGAEGGEPHLISSLEAQYMDVYPRGASEIKCVTSNPEGGDVQLRWSSTGGTLTGAGDTVTWQAPNAYGDYHIMVVAEDSNGESAEAVITISVVPRPYRGCCGRR